MVDVNPSCYYQTAYFNQVVLYLKRRFYLIDFNVAAVSAPYVCHLCESGLPAKPHETNLHLLINV